MDGSGVGKAVRLFPLSRLCRFCGIDATDGRITQRIRFMLIGLLLTAVVSLPTASPSWTGQEKPEAKAVPREEVRGIIAAVVQAAEENVAQTTERLRGDALLDFYVRRAARAARTQRASVPAFLIGLGVALDHTDFLRKNPLLKLQLLRWETDEERKRRLQVIGRPALRQREDWALHFAISAALTAHLGPEKAEQLGIAKELWDAQGTSGFSFADLAADYAGIAFAEMLLGKDGDKKLAALVDRFKGDDFLPRIDDLEDGLSWEQFMAKYGGPRDPRFLKHAQAIRERMARSPGLRPAR
jgi:hypothetical protein